MDADVVGDLVARERRSDRPALRALPSGREQSYRDFCTTAYKAGNFLRYLGVGPGDRVAVAADPRPEPVVTFLGAALLGAVTRFGDPATADGGGAEAERGDAPGRLRAVVAGVEREADLDPPPGRRLAVYGGEPAGAATAHWERDVWSENPAFPPTDVAPGDPILAAGDGSDRSHADALAAAAAVADALELSAGDAVALRAPLSDLRAAVGGVLAPLLAGGTVVLVGDGADGEAAGGDGVDATAAVVADGAGAESAPEARTLSVAEIDP